MICPAIAMPVLMFSPDQSPDTRLVLTTALCLWLYQRHAATDLARHASGRMYRVQGMRGSVMRVFMYILHFARVIASADADR
jgi:hypothetical protein